MADIKEVARKAGVSISTVSRVMNCSKNVSEELKEKVERAIDDLSYSPNSIGRSLKSVATKEIAVIVTSISRVFFLPVLEGITYEATKSGYVVQIMETHDNIEKEMELVDFSVAQWVDGIILASSAYESDERTLGYLNRLGSLEKRGQKIPVIEIEYSSRNKNVSSVLVDHKKAAYEAVEYLIRDIGKSKIVHISLPEGHYMGALRIEGYREALLANSLTYSEENVINGDYTTYSGYRITLGLLEKGIPFDAIFCANDQMAVGALKACEEQGMRIPEDVAVMGYDDIFTASIVSPTLSSVMVPKFEMGSTAMSQLKRELNGESPSGLITILDTKVIERESTRRGAYQSLKHLNW